MTENFNLLVILDLKGVFRIMFWIKIIIVIVLILAVFWIYDFIKNYRIRHCAVKCGVCGSVNTELKNNDTVESFYNRSFFDGVTQGEKKYVVHNPPTYYCKDCKKEYGLSEGEWVKKRKNKKCFLQKS